MATASRRRIGPVDTIWLNMDRPTNLMVIESLMFLADVPDWDEVTELLRTRVVERFPVFHQRPEPSALIGQPSWVDDEDFSLDRHLVRVTLPPPGDDAALQKHVETQLHVPLDRAHPLWQVHFVEGYGTGAAIFLRIHHSLADGIALTRVLMSLTDGERDDLTIPALTSEVTTALAPEVPEVTGELPIPRIVGAGLRLARDGVDELLRLTSRHGVTAAAQGAVRTAQVVRELLLGHNPDNVLDGAPGGVKRVVWSDPIPLDGVKQLGRLAGGTLNDVLMSAVAAALHQYQLARGREPVDLITMVPVNVRPLDKPLPPELGNQFALVYFRFPSALGSPLARVAETKRRMDWIKHSPEAPLTFALISAIGRTNAFVERYFVDFFANKAIGVTTNVAGPRSTRTLAGTPVTGVLGWVPGSGRQVVGVCVFTYAGTVRVGFMTDAAIVPDPERLLEAFQDELDHIVHIGRPLPRRRASRTASGTRRGTGSGTRGREASRHAGRPRPA